MNQYKIYKYKFDRPDKQGIVGVHMPIGSDRLSVGLDPNGDIVLWARVFTTNELHTRHFQLVNTGADCPLGPYVGTVIVGRIVWHIFEVD